MIKLSLWTVAPDDPSEGSCASTLEHLLKQQLPDASISVVHVVERWGRTIRKTLLREGIAALQSWFPGFWGGLYDSNSPGHSMDPMAQLRHLFTVEDVLDEIDKESFDLVIVCHPIALWLASQVRWSHLESDPLRSFPVLAWLPSFHAHPSQVQPGISRYGLSHPDVMHEWLELGISKDKLQVIGIPKSKEGPSHEEARQQLGVADLSQPVVLLRADRLEEAELSLWFQQCSLLSLPFQWWLDYGEDSALASHLRKEAKRWSVPARMFGHQADRRSLFYAAADVVLLRAKPWSVMEVLTNNTPVVLWQPRPGAETQDADFLTTHHLGTVMTELLSMDTALKTAISLKDSPSWQTTLSLMLLKDVQIQWSQTILEMIDQRDTILHRDAALLLSELTLLQPEPQQPKPEKTHPLAAPTTSTTAPVFEEIGQAPPTERLVTSSPQPKDETFYDSIRKLSIEKELAQLKQRMKIDRAHLDLSKLEEE